MTSILSSDEISEAMDACASEPIHIPGTVQPFGCLVATDKKTRLVTYCSANTEQFLDLPPENLLGRNLSDILAGEIWHELNNLQAQEDSLNASIIVGDFQVGSHLLTLHASESAGMLLLDFELARPAEFSDASIMKTFSFLTAKLEECGSEDALFYISTRLLRHLTEFDRVMIYRFDHSFNGEVLKEDRHSSMPSLEGLRFPHWDIPPQARAMMEKLPLRFIVDANQTPVPLKSYDPAGAPLDISLSVTRGVSSVHMQYLHNLQVSSTMTLTIKLEGALWGMISFHHRTPKLVSAQMRSLLVNFARIFSSKLQVLQQKSYLSTIARMDSCKDRIQETIGNDVEFLDFAKMVLEVLGACGLVVLQSGHERVYGQVPGTEVRSALTEALEAGRDLGHFDSLAHTFPALSDKLNDCAGALVLAPASDRTLFVFRPAIEREVAWAGSPDKQAEVHDGQLRLSPRGSFTTYLETVKGTSSPWSSHDLYFAERFWTLINSLDRSELVSTLNRQQRIMINELNHRVRNILALVRSVSQQAQSSSYGSLDSYSRSLEARIEALAASHDLASGSLTMAVPIIGLIEREFEPFVGNRDGRLLLLGESRDIRPELAPIFSLVLHELVTNTVKYGALSVPTGRVTVDLQMNHEGLKIHWTETGGPKVQEPAGLGFGTTLIKEAIPFELNGDAELRFEQSGVVATFSLPGSCFETGMPESEPSVRAALPAITDQQFRKAAKSSSCLLVEDNFIIATSTADQLRGFGVEKVEVAASDEAARDCLQTFNPTFAVLDISLGNGKTSLALAQALQQQQVPFIFVTGFGDRHQLAPGLEDVVKLTKPVPTADLRNALGQILVDNVGAEL